MNKFDQLIDQLDDLIGNDQAMDKLVLWMCVASALACIGIMAVT